MAAADLTHMQDFIGDRLSNPAHPQISQSMHGRHGAGSAEYGGKTNSIRVAQSKFLQNISLSSNKQLNSSSVVPARLPGQVHNSQTCMSATNTTKNSHNVHNHQSGLGSP